MSISELRCLEMQENQPRNLRIDEYEMGKFFVCCMYIGAEVFRRIYPKSRTSEPSWEMGVSGEASIVSAQEEIHILERLFAKRSAFQTIRRFPRTGRRFESLFTKLREAHQTADPIRMRSLLRQFQDMLDASAFGSGSLDSWDNLPRFDPSRVRRTRWLIDSFLPEESVQLIVGERGAFKSTLLLAAARAVASGERFLGMKTLPRRVLYLDYENPASVIGARNADLDLNLPSNERLIVWDRFGDKPIPRPEDPLLYDLVRRCKAETGNGPWIILDSWASLLKSGEGGELAGQIAPAYSDFRNLVDAGATVSVLDHTRKYDKSTIYGGLDKEAKADSIHTLLVYEGGSAFGSAIVQVKSRLKRYAPEGVGGFAFEVQSRQDKNGEWHIADIVPAGDPVEAARDRNIELLSDTIRVYPTSGQEELARLASRPGFSRDQAVALLKEGKGKHWRIEKGPRNKSYYRLIQK
jgi:AAA domain